jgi:aryl-alcohol dehydrogenase-like predicted oxidoreductase
MPSPGMTAMSCMTSFMGGGSFRVLARGDRRLMGVMPLGRPARPVSARARGCGSLPRMEHRHLGRSGLRVSALALGTMTFGGRGRFAMVGETDIAAAARQIDMALDAGVDLVDTADVYSDGLSEDIIGEILERNGRRDRVILATKARMPMGDGPNDAGLSRHHLVAACEASLRRLRADHIDLYQVHEWDGVTPLEETLGALDDLVRAGKVRYVGCSNYSGWQLVKALGVSERRGFERFVSQQIHYTLQAREAEYELIPAALDQGVGVMVWSPLAGGLLSGKFRRGQQRPEGTRALSDWGEPPVLDPDALYDIVDVLVEIADARGVSAAQVALAWLLGRPGVSTVVIGARTDEQLADNLAAADLELSEEERARLDEVSAPPLLYPHWHQARTASDRLGAPELSLLGPHVG